MATTMTRNPHLMEFVEESNGLSGIFLDDSKYKPRNTVGYSWNDDEFTHHYDVLSWVISLAKQKISPTAIEVNTRLMEKFMKNYRDAGKLRRINIQSNRILIPVSEVANLYILWEAASQRYAYLSHSRYDSKTGRVAYQGCPYCQSIWLHRVFMYIRPFEDGNARTARMLWVAHQIIGGTYPVSLYSKELPMCVVCAEEYDEKLIEFTRYASIVEITKNLNEIFHKDIEASVACFDTSHSHDLNVRDLYNDPTQLECGHNKYDRQILILDDATLLLPATDIECSEEKFDLVVSMSSENQDEEEKKVE